MKRERAEKKNEDYEKKSLKKKDLVNPTLFLLQKRGEKASRPVAVC